jgi:hypothetical protein
MGTRHQRASVAQTPDRARSGATRSTDARLFGPRVGASAPMHAEASRPDPAPPSVRPDFGQLAIRPPPGPDGPDTAEQAADRLAEQVVSMREPAPRSMHHAPTAEPWTLPERPRPHPLMHAPGQALPAAVGNDMAARFGTALGAPGLDFGRVRIHTGPRAAAATGALGALAYAAGNHVVFNAGAYAPHTPAGRRLLAHELAHVTQNAPELRCYRPNSKRSWNYGRLDAGTLVEDSFEMSTDRQSKPWLEKVHVEFDGLETDTNGHAFSTGKASAQYYDNPVKWSNFSFEVGGGSRTLGKTDSGTFSVKRIEGVGYNSGAYSGTAGVDYDASDREGPGQRYSKSLSANMSYAVFYNGGEALHAGPLDFSSHGCVHVDWSSLDTIKQLNYHSVIGHTRVTVKYLSKEEIERRRIEAQIRREALRGVRSQPGWGGRLPPP